MLIYAGEGQNKFFASAKSTGIQQSKTDPDYIIIQAKNLPQAAYFRIASYNLFFSPLIPQKNN